MAGQFRRQGISCQYPENWSLEDGESEFGWAVTLQSPATAFFTISLDQSGAGIGETADAALDALREVYPKLDAEPVTATVAGLPAVGYDVEFFSLDLSNTAGIRALASPQGTVLILWEATDSEVTNLAVCRAICVSLNFGD